MKRCLALFAALTITSSTASDLDPILQKYKHRYLHIEEADVERIGEFLTSPEPEERGEAATQISAALREGSASARRFIPALIELLATDSDEGVKVRAASALYKSKDLSVVEPLLEVARDTTSYPLLRQTALHGLFMISTETDIDTREIEEIAVRELDSPHYGLRYDAIRVLGRSTDRQKLERLMEAYMQHHERPDEALRKAEGLLAGTSWHDALSGILGGTPAAILRSAPDLLPTLIGHPNDRIRLDAASTLAVKRDDRAIPILIDLINSGADPHIRGSAVGILASGHGWAGRDKRAISALKGALKDESTISGRDGKPYREVADRAYQGLRQMGVDVEEPEDLRGSRPLSYQDYLNVDEADLPVVIGQLSSPDPKVRCEATNRLVMALHKGSASARKSIPKLIELLLSDEDERVRATAANALRASGDRRAVEPLLSAARDASLSALVRTHALRGLTRIELYGDEKEAVIEETARIGLAELQASDYHLRFVAIVAAGASKDIGRLEEFLEAYVDHHEHPDESLENAAPPGLESTHEKLSEPYSLSLDRIARQAPDMLAPLLSRANPRIRLDVASALAKVEDPRVVPVLAVLVARSDDASRRQSAARLLGHFRSDERAIAALKGALKDTNHHVANAAYQALLRLGVKVQKTGDGWREPIEYRITQ